MDDINLSCRDGVLFCFSFYIFLGPSIFRILFGLVSIGTIWKMVEKSLINLFRTIQS